MALPHSLCLFVVSIWKKRNGGCGREINVSKFTFLSLHLAFTFKACSVKTC